MNYVDAIFRRCDIQQIREFLLHGTEGNIDPRPCKERAEDALHQVTARLRAVCANEADRDDLTGLVYACAEEIAGVYMEIGLQLGALLAAQLYQNLRTAFGEAEG